MQEEQNEPVGKNMDECHLSDENLSKALYEGKLFESVIRVNANSFEEAYCPVEGFPRDIFIKGLSMRSGAIHGDKVIIRILPSSKWRYLRQRMGECGEKNAQENRKYLLTDPKVPALGSDESFSMYTFALEELKNMEIKNDGIKDDINSFLTKDTALDILAKLGEKNTRIAGEVVLIKKYSPLRNNVSGHIRMVRSSNCSLFFYPYDKRLPFCYIKSQEGDVNALLRQKYPTQGLKTIKSKGKKIWRNYAFVGKIESWENSMKTPEIQLTAVLDDVENVETGIAVVLQDAGIFHDETFDKEILDKIPDSSWNISKEELESRLDLRNLRIFSIDPENARDLDDALSIERIEGGRFRVGVHIADVSYFIRPNTALDIEAFRRSTSVYLIDRVIPMLPRRLCEDLCSLQPGKDRLTVSVFWEMDQSGKVYKTSFSRSIIQSCAKLSYQEAQGCIDLGQRMRKPVGLKIFGGKSWADICGDILNLWEISRAVRDRRYENGSLKLDNVKNKVVLDAQGQPVSFCVYPIVQANYLIEEFMLMANISVAKVLLDAPSLNAALLRNHPPPEEHKLNELKLSISMSVPDAPALDISSAGSLQKSLTLLQEYFGKSSQHKGIISTITYLCTKPMNNAAYFSTTDDIEISKYSHYALATDCYTHFTSPIRRYPDIIVHRLLLETMESDSKKSARPEEIGPKSIAKIANHCNERKLRAKAAEDKLIDFYICHYLSRHPTVFLGIVCSVGGPRWIDVFVPLLGTSLKVNFESTGLRFGTQWYSKERSLKISARGNKSRKESSTFRGELRNPESLKKINLPLSIRLFSEVPLLIEGKKENSGSFPEFHASLWAD